MDGNCTDGEINGVMAEFSYSMMVSGYPESTRRDIVKGVLERSEEVEKEIREGTRIRFRTRSEIDEQKRKDKNRHRNTWYLKGGATGVLFVPATPGSQLCKQVREGIKDMRCPDGGLTKVVEAGGASILAGLGRSDPFRVLECPFEEVCWVKGGGRLLEGQGGLQGSLPHLWGRLHWDHRRESPQKSQRAHGSL